MLFFVISLLRRLLSDSPQREFQMLTLFLRILHSVSLPRRIRNCKVYIFESLLKRILWQGYLCSSFLVPPSSSLFYFISIHDTRTHHYTLLNLACLENTWKMSLLEGGCPMSITIHTSPNWINRSTVVRLRSHFSLSIVPRHRKLLCIFCFLSSLFLPLAAPLFFCCGRTMSQQRYPLSINRCKQATRPYQPPGLIKSNFFFYWPTAKRCSFFIYFRIIFCLPSLTTRLRNYANCRTTIVWHNSIHHIHVSSIRRLKKKEA